MTREEAKQKLGRVEVLCQERKFAEAWPILEELQAAFPNSRSVVYHAALCLSGMGRFDEALDCCEQLDGKAEPEQIAALRNTIAAQQRAADAPGQQATGASDETNLFEVESVFPQSSEETTVTGHVRSGAFYSGDSVSLVSATGLPLLCPILRIGSKDTPMKMVRQGQRTTMLLKVEPQHISTGSKLTSSSTAESYAATMVVTDEADAAPATAGPAESPSDPQVEKARKLLDERRIVDARTELESCLSSDSDNRDAHWLMARSYLEADDEMQDPDKALEYVKRAYELGGGQHRGVLETLSMAMGAKGEAEHGLRFLERAYTLVQDETAQAECGKRVVSYRNRYNLGHIWEFQNGFGDVVFESSDMAAICKAIENGTVPENARIRKDHVGNWGSIEEMLGDQPAIRELFGKNKTSYTPMVVGASVLGFVLGAGVTGLVRGFADVQRLLLGGFMGAIPLALIAIGVAIMRMKKK